MKVERVDQTTARDWFRQYHYTGSIGNSQVGRFAVSDDEGKVVSMVAIGNAGNVHGLAKKLDLYDYKGNIEVTRVATHPDAPSMTTTQAVAAVLRQLGEEGWEWVFSYADSGQGHHGGIYQALNAVYIGRSPGAILFTLDGTRLHNRIIAEKYRTTKWIHAQGELCPGKLCSSRRCPGRQAALDGHDLQKDWDGSSDKHTYILVCAKRKRDRLDLKKHLAPFALPFPKRGEEPAEGAPLLDEEEAEEAAREPVRLEGSTLRLRPFQRVGAAFLATARQALLGDDMRLGKTPQVIRALQLLQAQGETVFPVLVVAPAAVRRVWERHFADWWPGARIGLPKSGTANAELAIRDLKEYATDVLVLNYEALPNLSRLAGYGAVALEGCRNCDPLSTRDPRRCQREAKALNDVPWRTVIVDEAHRVKEPKTQYTRALWAVGDGAEFRFALTGTPVANEPSDLWSIMRFVSPSEFPAKGKFVERYVLTTPNIWSGFPDPVGFREDRRPEFDRIFLPRFLRRTKEMVHDFVEPVRVLREPPMGAKQQKAYDQMRKEMIAAVNDGSIFASNPLLQTTRLRQLAATYGEALEDNGLRMTEPSSKLDDLDDFVVDFGEDEPLVIFAESRQLIDLAVTRFEKRERTVATLVGGQSDRERTDAHDGFQEGRYQYVFCTTGAAGEGISLNRSDALYWLQKPWSAVKETQAEDRIYEEGRASLIVESRTPDSVEERVAEALADKANTLEDLVKDKEMLLRWLA